MEGMKHTLPDRVSTGLAGLDAAIGGLAPGENVVWQINDLVEDCPLDLEIEFLPGALRITDLDGDGLNEIWVVYRLGCRGVVRMDWILAEDGLYFLEINTIPGMTSASLVPKMVRTAGLDMTAFLSTIIENC